MASYRFADPSKLRHDRIGGRIAFPKDFKPTLMEFYGSKCSVCNGDFEARYLQIDHRVPFEVAGEQNPSSSERIVADYQLLDGSCNRAKFWSCEHCHNWTSLRESEICRNCYWAQPETYNHIAMRDVRRLDLTWVEEETKSYDKLKNRARTENVPIPDFVKAILELDLAE